MSLLITFLPHKMSSIPRFALCSLKSWRDHPLRKPLLLRGARQVGKSYLVRQFGLEFEHFIEINFEKDKQIKHLFTGSLAPQLLIQKIAGYVNKPVIPGKTLLFFDEIQECEEAITALRYFKEELQALHVIAAGSLVDFKLNKMGVPVGRLQFLYLYPLSFAEYCAVTEYSILFQQAKQSLKLDEALHTKLLIAVKDYCWIGGMPAAVDAWITHNNFALCQEIQDEILLSYRQDFNKYAKNHQVPYLERVFSNIGLQLGQKYKYTSVDPDLRAANLREALMLLEMAGVIHRVYHSSAQGLPLASGMDEKRFKVYFFDIGLLQRLLGTGIKEWLLKSLSIKHLGGMSEQFVCQEYVACTSLHAPPSLYYWHRENKQSNAEIDFLFVKNNTIIPVEVKSGRFGHMKSLKLFLESHSQSPYGLKISESNESDFESMESIPFYAIQAWLAKDW